MGELYLRAGSMALPVLVIHLELSEGNSGLQAERRRGERCSFRCPLVLG